MMNNKNKTHVVWVLTFNPKLFGLIFPGPALPVLVPLGPELLVVQELLLPVPLCHFSLLVLWKDMVAPSLFRT